MKFKTIFKKPLHQEALTRKEEDAHKANAKLVTIRHLKTKSVKNLGSNQGNNKTFTDDRCLLTL